MADPENLIIPQRYARFMQKRHVLMGGLVARAKESETLYWLDDEGHEEREVDAPWLPSGVQTRYIYRRAVYVIREDTRLLADLADLQNEQKAIMRAAEPPLKTVPRKLLLPHLAHGVARVNVTAYPSFSSRVEPLPVVYNELADKLDRVKGGGDEEREKRLQGYLDTLRALWDGGEETLRVRFPNWQVDAHLHDADDAVAKVNLRLVGVICVAPEPERVVVQLPQYRVRKRMKSTVLLEPDARLGAAYVYGETRWQRAKRHR